jgi:hypothetical protein
MDKFLFTDGTNGVREAQSQEELQVLVDAAEDKSKIRIWLFSSNEWISFAAFKKQLPTLTKKDKPGLVITHQPGKNNLLNGHASHHTNAEDPGEKPVPGNSRGTGKRLLKKFLYITGAAAGVFLVFNFTKVKWEEAIPVSASAARPLNVPLMDMDSLITEIEEARGQILDRSTRTNLRLRNTWPDRILLRLAADKETSAGDSRFFNLNISIDNSTGFHLDNAVVRLSVWKNRKASSTDTLHFNNIRYNKISERQLAARYKGDSISVSFELIKAKAFNFCYLATTKNNSGNYNDRWFCRE